MDEGMTKYGLLGAYLGAHDPVGLAGPGNLPKSENYARTYSPGKIAVAQRSRNDPYYSYGIHTRRDTGAAIFVCIEWERFPGDGYQNLPADFGYFNGSGQTGISLHFDLLRYFPPFTRGYFKISGYNAEAFPSVWNVSLETMNSEYTTFVIPPGNFVVAAPMTAQAIFDINLGVYPTNPGSVQTNTNQFTRMTGLSFYLKR